MECFDSKCHRPKPRLWVVFLRFHRYTATPSFRPHRVSLLLRVPRICISCMELSCLSGSHITFFFFFAIFMYVPTRLSCSPFQCHRHLKFTYSEWGLLACATLVHVSGIHSPATAYPLSRVFHGKKKVIQQLRTIWNPDIINSA